MGASRRPFSWEAVISVVGYGLLGALAGIVGTFAHRQRTTLFGVEIWYGWFVALAAIALIGIGLRATAEDRIPVTSFGAGVVIASLVLASGGVGGHSVVVAASGGLGPGEIWTYGAPIVALLPAIWPKLRRRTELPGAERSGRDYPGRPVASTADAAGVPATDASGTTTTVKPTAQTPTAQTSGTETAASETSTTEKETES